MTHSMGRFPHPASPGLGARIRRGRTAMSLTMAQLGYAAGTTSMAISHYERGKREPKASTLVAIADALGVSLDWLARGER